MWGNLIAGSIVLTLVSVAVFSIYKNRKQGKCCGCDNSCCNKNNHCNR